LILVNVPKNIDCVDVGKWWELFSCIDSWFFVYLHIDEIIVCIDINVLEKIDYVDISKWW
jgi:hypothetical protein